MKGFLTFVEDFFLKHPVHGDEVGDKTDDAHLEADEDKDRAKDQRLDVSTAAAVNTCCGKVHESYGNNDTRQSDQCADC